MWATEAEYFADMHELEHVRDTIVELPCDGSGSSGTDGTSVVHLTGCKITGPVIFDETYPGLEELSEFKENLPEDGVPGVSFKVNIQQYSRRRSNQWGDVDNVENLHKAHVFSQSSRVGVYSGVGSVFASLPHDTVQLRPSLNFHQQVNFWTGITPPYSSTNMLVKDDHLYTSDSCPDSPYDSDVNLWFEVADADQRVSIIAREPIGQTLQAWTVPGYDSNDWTVSKLGVVEAPPMLDEIEIELSTTFGIYRIFSLVMTWLSTWCLVFPAYACDCCKKNPDHVCENLKALCRAIPLSLVPSGVVMGMSWGIWRNPLLTCLVAAILLAISVFLLFGWDPCSALQARLHASPDPNATVTYAPSQGLLQRFPSVRWPGGVRPTVGDSVRIRATNKTGLIQADDRTDLPYKVVFDDGSQDWFTEMAVDVVNAAEAEPSNAPEPQAPSLQEPLLVAENSSFLSATSATGVESNNHRPMMSHTVRAMVLGLAVGLVVSIVALAALAFLGK